MSCIQNLIDTLSQHPDYDGEIETTDLPHDMVAEVYEELGDDLSMHIPGAKGFRDDEAGIMLIAPPESERDDWMVRYVGQDPIEAMRSIEFANETDDDLLRKIRSVVGNDATAVKAFRGAIERAYKQLKADIDKENSALEQGWKRLPVRSDDEVIANALMQYQMAE